MADARGYAGQIFRYAIATARAERDVAADLRDAFPKHTRRHFKALREDQLPSFLKALDDHKEGWRGRLGIKLILLTLVRTTELRAARWSEFDFDAAQWVIPAHRMKMRREHIVPLACQTLKLLTELKSVTGEGVYLFPNRRSKKHPYMSENTMLNLLGDLGYGDKTTVHGIRSTGSTILHETGKFRSLVIERQLAHIDSNSTRKAYNRAEYMEERRVMMQWWADYLSEAADHSGKKLQVVSGQE